MSMAHGDYGVDPGAARSNLYFEITAKLTHARSNSKDANPWSEGSVLIILRIAFHAVSIVSNDQMDLTGDLSQDDACT